MNNDIVLSVQGVLGRMRLNRPSALNALNFEMCAAMLRQMQDWAADPSIATVMIDAVPGRAFSAGGDLRAVYAWGKSRDPRAAEFFATEYRLNAAIKHFSKPYIALIDGIVMGGGAGVSIHGSHRVVSENALFAMPETAIGFFPDIGASYFLSRLPGGIGLYLALTGARLKGRDMVYAGLATHFVSASRFPEIGLRLAAGETPDVVLRGLGESVADPPLATHRRAIDRIFGLGSVEEILAALAGEGTWGAETTALIGAGSPTSAKLAFRALREGVGRDLDSCLDMEYRLATHVLEGHDFYEGVRARLIDKDANPQWRPQRLDQVGDSEIASYFAPAGYSDPAL